jgi:hypothetical protein
MKAFLTLATVAIAAATVVTPSVGSPAAFRGSVAPISQALERQMTGVSWRPGCPVLVGDLRLVSAVHRGFDGRDHLGQVIVHRDVAAGILAVMRRLYVERFPIRRMTPIDAYGGSDYRSIEADNTSGFNCRFVEGTSRYSEHAYGRAIDINPIENPYVTRAGTTSHPASVPFLRRTPLRSGMAAERHVLVRAFDTIGWGWGGRWSGARDYQHFSASGR